MEEVKTLHNNIDWYVFACIWMNRDPRDTFDHELGISIIQNKTNQSPFSGNQYNQAYNL